MTSSQRKVDKFLVATSSQTKISHTSDMIRPVTKRVQQPKKVRQMST